MTTLQEYQDGLDKCYEIIANTLQAGASLNPILMVSTSKEAIDEISVMTVALMFNNHDFIGAFTNAVQQYANKIDNS